MRIVIAPQEFKGTLTARHAAEAMAAGARRAAPDAEIDSIPISDGGPGLCDALLSAAPGRLLRAAVQDPLGRTIEAEWALLDDNTAVIETASAAGLWRLTPAERDPLLTTTWGVGQLILAALDTGARRLIIGLGGSATNDGGAGMAVALGARLLNDASRHLPRGGAALARLYRIDTSNLDSRLKQTDTIAAADVINPLCGPEGASLVYGPQKGASPNVARELDDALRHYAQIIERDLGFSVLDAPGAGAAGGLGAGLIGFLHATVRPGFDIVADAVHLHERLKQADLVLTGEGRLDGQTRYGKAVTRLARLASDCGVPVIVVPGSLGDGWETLRPLVHAIEPILSDAVPQGAKPAHPAGALASITELAVQRWILNTTARNP